MKREERAESAIALTRDDRLKLVDPLGGWPSVASLDQDDQLTLIAIHTSQVGDYHRKPHEWRFQNPASGQKVDADLGYPILLGYDDSEEPTILVVVDGRSRVGRTTRFSILFDKSILKRARERGFAEYRSSSGESIYALHPEFLGTLIDALVSGVAVSELAFVSVADSSGFNDQNTEMAAVERMRRAANVLVRNSAFGNRVRKAYGYECAMCGLGAGTVAGAHIYPANAPGSPDVTPNGVCLCANHHILYDAGDLWFGGNDMKIDISQSLIEKAKASKSLADFLSGTSSKLRLPASAEHYPSKEMLDKRLEFMAPLYSWL
jgi:putative restriction endonuclease